MGCRGRTKSESWRIKVEKKKLEEKKNQEDGEVSPVSLFNESGVGLRFIKTTTSNITLCLRHSIVQGETLNIRYFTV